MREVFVGFDSAWTDNPRKPGAIGLVEFVDRRASRFIEPKLATFDDALDLIEARAAGADLVLVAIDQPTRVPNRASCRPVERVAASVLSKIQGGVQPSNRSRIGMFDDDAPIWRFLGELRAIENPETSRTADEGRFLIEVFPALALASLLPDLMTRRQAAKYNPGRPRTFNKADWVTVASALSDYADALGIVDFSAWSREMSQITAPRKPDQDRLDAGICLLLSVLWRHGPAPLMTTIGDLETGYMVTPVTSTTEALLRSAAKMHNTGYNIC